MESVLLIYLVFNVVLCFVVLFFSALCIVCLRSVSCLSPSCVLFVSVLCIVCLRPVYCLFPSCVLFVSVLCLVCLRPVYSLSPPYVLFVSAMCLVCPRPVSCVPIVPFLRLSLRFFLTFIYNVLILVMSCKLSNLLVQDTVY